MAIDTLVLGASGMLGSAFDSFGLGHKLFDVRDTKLISSIIEKIKPKHIINCSGLSELYQCESNPDLARELNYVVPLMLASICNAHGVKFIQFSTIHSVSDNTYATTKRMMEKSLGELIGDYAIVKVGWIFSQHNDRKFLSTIIDSSVKGEPVPIYQDEIGSPTYNKDVAEYVMDNIDTLNGIVSIANSGDATRQEWVDEVGKIIGIDIATKPIKRTIPMLEKSNCADIRFKKHWKEALRECLS